LFGSQPGSSSGVRILRRQISTTSPDGLGEPCHCCVDRCHHHVCLVDAALVVGHTSKLRLQGLFISVLLSYTCTFQVTTGSREVCFLKHSTHPHPFHSVLPIECASYTLMALHASTRHRQLWTSFRFEILFFYVIFNIVHEENQETIECDFASVLYDSIFG